jgi:hypothetical protein
LFQKIEKWTFQPVLLSSSKSGDRPHGDELVRAHA